MSGGVGRPDPSGFAAYLRSALSALHHEPTQIEHDDELLCLLLDLYDTDDLVAIQRAVQLYVSAHALGLSNVWQEHSQDPSFALLDRPEALVVLERAEHASERLTQVWPEPRSWLTRVSDVWGVPI